MSEKGLYDSATERYLPVRFYDFIQKKWDDGAPGTNLDVPGGNYSPAMGATFLEIERRGLALQKSQNGGTGVPGPGQVRDPAVAHDARRDGEPRRDRAGLDRVMER